MSSPPPRRWPLALAAALLLLSGLAWLAWTPRAPPDGVGVTQALGVSVPPVMPPVTPSVTPRSPQAPAPQAHTEPAQQAPAPGAALSEAALASIEAQWCSHGSLQESQQQAAALAGEGDELDPEAQARLTRMEASWPSTQARRQIRDRLLASWQASLRRRGDDASLALALLISHAPHEHPPLQALQRLQDLAVRSSDPWVQVVALQRRGLCQNTPGCHPAPAERWPLLEPENLAAWVASAPPEALPSASRWKQWAQARRWDDGSSRLLLTLLDLPWPASPGLEQEVAVLELTSWRLSWSTALPLPLTRACRMPKLPPQPRQLCAQAADWLWGTPGASLLDWAIAVQLAHPGELGSEARWQAREQLVTQAKDEASREGARFSPESTPGDRCAWQGRLLQHLRNWAEHSEGAQYARP